LSMDTSEFQKDVKRTMNPEVVGIEVLKMAAMKIAEEGGEFNGVVAKWQYQGHELDYDRAVDELVDILFYVTVALDWLGWELDGALERNMEKRAERYPNGFEAERSINR